MVQEYFVAQVRATEERADRSRAALRDRGDAEAYVREVQEKIRRSFGPRPPKTPLKPRITGVVERDQYKIEKLIFESRPGFLVTGNLYVPKGRDFPLPGVVGTCGHSSNGKASEFYQAYAQGLARQASSSSTIRSARASDSSTPTKTSNRASASAFASTSTPATSSSSSANS